jgi:hypothetical protein
MRRSAISLVLVGAALVSLLPATAAQARCRPTTLADFPAPDAPPQTVINLDGSATELPPAPRVALCSYVYRMLWPIVGGGSFGSSFGADRDGGTRWHAGNDLLAPKMTPVVAVQDGTIKAIHDQPGDCCWIVIAHNDGWSSWYVHLNNDVEGSDNGHGVGIRPGLIEGAPVVAGEVIGWVGDSGNAEPGPPHLHFELHGPWGPAIDPYASLRWAYRRMVPPAWDNSTEIIGPYVDDDASTAEPVFGRLTSLGAITPCDEWGVEVCPDLVATNLDAATWIGALGGVVVSTSLTDEPTPIAPIINQGLACPYGGCTTERMITAGEVAAILVWAVDQRRYDDAVAASEDDDFRARTLPALPIPYWEMDSEASWSELVTRGLADNCLFTAPTLGALLSRFTLAEMAAKAFGYLPVISCGENLS